MKKIFFLMLLFPLTLLGQENDTLVTMSTFTRCQIYAIEGTHLRYREKGVGKIISISDIITCSTPWKHKIDSMNGTRFYLAHVPSQMQRFLQNACKDTAKTCTILTVEIGKLNMWNASFDHVLFDLLTKTEISALIMSLDYGQPEPATMLTRAYIPVKDNTGASMLNGMVASIKYMISKGWAVTSCYENTESSGQMIYSYSFARK